MKSETEIFLLKFKELTDKLERYRLMRNKAQFGFSITLERLSSIARSLELVGRPIPIELLPPELRVTTKGNIADAIEKIILENGAMTRKEITTLLVRSGRIAPKNARIVVFNAIREKKENFLRIRRVGDRT